MAKCCDYTAGMLREPVEIQEQVTVPIGGGATELAYQTKANVRAYVKPMSGSERLYAERLDATTRNRIVMRYRPNIVESDRIVMRGKAYNIRFIHNVEFRDRWLEIDVDGGVAT